MPRGRSHATHGALAQRWKDCELARDVDAAHRFELGWTEEAVREADAAQGTRATKLGNSRLARIKKHGLTSALFGAPRACRSHAVGW